MAADLKRIILAALVVAGLLPGMAGAATPTGRADPRGLIADISSNQIAITSSFKGTSLLLFGAIDWRRVQHDKWQLPSDMPQAAGGSSLAYWNRRPFDVVVVVTGPRQSYVVRRKEQVAGVWVNRHAATVRDLPGFYALSSTRAPEDILDPDQLRQYPMGFDHLDFRWSDRPRADQEMDYRNAVLRDLIDAGLYAERPTSLVVMDHTLFRAEVDFPANVPVGPYAVNIYLVRDGKVIAHQTAPLSIDKIGFERAIYTFAKTEPALYGLIAVTIAILAGIFAGALTRRFTG